MFSCAVACVCCVGSACRAPGVGAVAAAGHSVQPGKLAGCLPPPRCCSGTVRSRHWLSLCLLLFVLRLCWDLLRSLAAHSTKELVRQKKSVLCKLACMQCVTCDFAETSSLRKNRHMHLSIYADCLINSKPVRRGKKAAQLCLAKLGLRELHRHLHHFLVPDAAVRAPC